MNGIPAVSLFSGAGGMDLGFEEAGFCPVWANDFDGAACKTYRLNHPGPIFEGPIQDHIQALKQLRGIDLVFGGPPCQGFSVAGKMDPDDERSQLIWSYFDALEALSARAFVLENVKALAALSKWRRVRRRMFERAYSLGYKTRLFVLNSQDFGVPQKRERMFLIGAKDLDLAALDDLLSRLKSKAPTIRTLCADLGPAGSATNPRICKARVTLAAKPVLRRSAYAGMLFNGQGRPINPDGHSATLHASMGGNKTPIVDEEHLHGSGPSWVEWYHDHLMKGGKPLGFDDAPSRLRRLTLDEAIRIQTFPNDFLFGGGQSTAFRQIGNAVPPRLAAAVARAMHQLMDVAEAPPPIARSAGQLELILENA